MVSKKRWLKKYTKLEYLSDVLSNQQLHLGHPRSWDDRNDAAAIGLYRNQTDACEIRATCFTQAKDRFHFWHIFGERQNGVCLWFDKDALVKDIAEDTSLIAEEVKYPVMSALSRTELKEIPFTKREQYADEQEFRVLSVRGADITSSDKLKFSPFSLKRIYLNPWLTKIQVETNKQLINRLLREFGYSKIEIFQNRTLEHKNWIESLSASTKSQSLK
jgi:hypothetical protein